MAQRELQIGNKIEFMGKKYRAESEEKTKSCVGCAFRGYSPCPMSGNCVYRGFIFKEVKEETIYRHIELSVVKIEDILVTFKIIEQTHRKGDFSQQAESNTFKASNGIKLMSCTELRLFCCGYNYIEDDCKITCTVTDFAKICEAISEYNATDGKGYEKPWPQSGDIYFYVNSDCTIVSDSFYGTSIGDKGRFDCGNFFRTKEDAMAAAEEIKALLKKISERKK